MQQNVTCSSRPAVFKKYWQFTGTEKYHNGLLNSSIVRGGIIQEAISSSAHGPKISLDKLNLTDMLGNLGDSKWHGSVFKKSSSSAQLQQLIRRNRSVILTSHSVLKIVKLYVHKSPL